LQGCGAHVLSGHHLFSAAGATIVFVEPSHHAIVMENVRATPSYDNILSNNIILKANGAGVTMLS
jgi:hypothetical protein